MLEPREFNMGSVHRWAEENKVSKEVMEQELLKCQQNESRVKPRKIKPRVVKKERAKVKQCNRTVGPSGTIARRCSPKRTKTHVVKVPADVNLKQCSVVLPADLDESGVKNSVRS